MQTRDAYNQWAAQYDSNQNKTRDLEGISLRTVLASIPFAHCLEIGCGTGKNTVWLAQQAVRVTAVDFSEEMLAKAKEKITSSNVAFLQADITLPWQLESNRFDLVSFSLVLEHIEDLEPVFREATRVLQPGGSLYLGELHPFKQYTGSKARYETETGTQVLTCFTHHVSDYIQAAEQQGLQLSSLQEFFDENDRNSFPRILAIRFQKPLQNK